MGMSLIENTEGVGGGQLQFGIISSQTEYTYDNKNRIYTQIDVNIESFFSVLEKSIQELFHNLYAFIKH